MLIKYTAQASFTATSGIVFNNGDTKEVEDKLGRRLIETFIGMFEDVTPAPTKSEPKVEVKPKAKTEDK